MAEKQQQKAAVVDKKKIKKRWYPILAPKLFNGQQVGEGYAEEPRQLEGRTVTLNLMTLTRDPKKQSIEVTLKVKEIKNNQAETELVSYGIMGTQVKRLTKKTKTRVNDSFIVTSNDNITYRIKPMILLKPKVANSMAANIRKIANEIIKDHAAKETYQKIVKDIISGTLQKELKDNVDKIHPTALCAIRALKRE